MLNPNKTASANSRGIIISFRDANKHSFISYEPEPVSKFQSSLPRYQEIEKPVFNKIQQKIYGQAVYGLHFYTEEQLSKLSQEKKNAITNTYNRVQNILNCWKQEIANKKVDNLFLRLFPHSPITKVFVNTKGSDSSIRIHHTFKDLGLSQEKVARKLIESRVLPENFFNLG